MTDQELGGLKCEGCWKTSEHKTAIWIVMCLNNHNNELESESYPLLLIVREEESYWTFTEEKCKAFN